MDPDSDLVDKIQTRAEKIDKIQSRTTKTRTDTRTLIDIVRTRTTPIKSGHGLNSG